MLLINQGCDSEYLGDAVKMPRTYLEWRSEEEVEGEGGEEEEDCDNVVVKLLQILSGKHNR